MKRNLSLAALLAACLLTVSACGTSSAPTKVREGRITPQTMGGEAAVNVPALGETATAGASRGVGDGVAVQRGHRTPGAGPDDQPTAAAPADPCRLVHASELEAVIHTNVVSTSVAPLGPTCIYKLAGPQREVTIALESGHLSTAARSLHRSRRLTLARQRAYCGGLGEEHLLVSLPAGRILDVSAPCRVAVRLARRALGRV